MTKITKDAPPLEQIPHTTIAAMTSANAIVADAVARLVLASGAKETVSALTASSPKSSFPWVCF